MEYGNLPVDLGLIELVPSEMMFQMYLPIKFPDRASFTLPKNIYYISPLLESVWLDFIKEFGKQAWCDHYVYVTAKTLYVSPGCSGNRPGWHVDGFGSDGDVNYLWYDDNPTQFAHQVFYKMPTDDFEVLLALEEQVDETNIVEYPCKHLLRLDEGNVHRVNPHVQEGIRTFIKISISKHKFNLKGNAHNYLLDYDWKMYDRQEVRNLDSNKDYM